MAVEEIGGTVGGERENYYNFSFVTVALAVDNDSICLKLLY